MVLAFPKEDSESDLASLARSALARNDYTQAINQATQAIAAGQSNTEIYAVLATAYFKTGSEEQAEASGRQCLALTGPDDEFRQTARLYLLRILGQKFKSDPTSVDRVAYLKLANEFLSLASVPIVSRALFEEEKREAASIPGILKSIVGTWNDASEAEGLAGIYRDTQYKIESDGSGGFRLSTAQRGSHGGLNEDVFGRISGTSDSFVGILERHCVSVSGGFAGAGRQPVAVVLRLSDDMMALEGTATYGDIRAAGDLEDMVLRLMRTRTGERRIKLVRGAQAQLQSWDRTNAPASLIPAVYFAPISKNRLWAQPP